MRWCWWPARTAPGRPRCCASWPGSSRSRPAGPSSSGHDLAADRHAVRAELALVGHAPGAYDDLTVRENVRFWVRAGGGRLADADAVLEELGLTRLAGVAFGRLSAGQQRRTGLAVALARRPRLLLLDEPHAGLDAAGRDLLDGLLRSSAGEGRTVLLVSHELDRARALADREVTIVAGVRPQPQLPSGDDERSDPVNPGAPPNPRPYRTELSPISFLRRSASVFPDRPAVVHGDRRYSYLQFEDRVDRLVRALHAAGLEPGDRVAFLAPNIPAMLEAHYGVPAAGGVLVAINTRLNSEEVGYILGHSGARFLFVDAELEPVTAPLDLSGVTVVRIDDTGAAGDPYEDQLEAAGPRPPTDPLPESWLDDEEATISINYTSGTTGRPKGVMYTHRGTYLNALGEVITTSMTFETVYLWTLPMFHCNGWCFTWAVTAVAGRHVCLRKVDSGRIWDLLESEGVTHFNGAPDRAHRRGQRPGRSPPRGAGHDHRGRRAAFADAARPARRPELPHCPRLRLDRDLRAVHRLRLARRLGRAPGRRAGPPPLPPGPGLRHRRPRPGGRPTTWPTFPATEPPSARWPCGATT